MRFDRRLTRRAKVDMTPLVDVLFMLLLFFMTTSVFKVVPGIPMNLPVSSTATSVSVTRLTVVVVSESEIYVNELRTGLQGLDTAISRQMEGKRPEEVRAVFQADKQVPYQLVVAVLDSFRKNGIEGVSLLTSARTAKP
jgi:biopolymer transport protein ExbD